MSTGPILSALGQCLRYGGVLAPAGTWPCSSALTGAGASQLHLHSCTDARALEGKPPTFTAAFFIPVSPMQAFHRFKESSPRMQATHSLTTFLPSGSEGKARSRINLPHKFHFNGLSLAHRLGNGSGALASSRYMHKQIQASVPST